MCVAGRLGTARPLVCLSNGFVKASVVFIAIDFLVQMFWAFRLALVVVFYMDEVFGIVSVLEEK